MTLIVAIPTALGLIIAADSRISTWSGYCDKGIKISEIQSRPRTATFMTGYTTVADSIDLSPCEHLSRLKFDAADLLRKSAERSNKLDVVIDLVLKGTREFIAANPHDYEIRRGLFLFQAAIASFDIASHRSRIESFSVNYGSDGSITADKIATEEYNLADDLKLKLFGESGFLIEEVFNGPGLQFLTDRYGRFRSTMTTVGNADTNLAADFAIDLIEATSKTSTLIRPETGIGGPVDVILLGEEERPKRLHWKP